MAKDQRLTFVIGKTKSGHMKVNMLFYPPLASTKDDFDSMPMDLREMQNKAQDIGRYVMERLASPKVLAAFGKVD